MSPSVDKADNIWYGWPGMLQMVLESGTGLVCQRTLGSRGGWIVRFPHSVADPDTFVIGGTFKGVKEILKLNNLFKCKKKLNKILTNNNIYKHIQP